MKKQIFSSMTLLTAISLVLAAAALCFVFYNQFSGQIRAELRTYAELFRDESAVGIIPQLEALSLADTRITLIAPDGTVMYDNTAAAEDMENHLDREEVREALESGYGESVRFSDTLGRETCYYSVRLADGAVLRMASTTDSIFGLFAGVLPWVAGVVLAMTAFCYLLAGRLTRGIIEPIINAGPGGEPAYDELVPFVRKIEQQRRRISSQLADLRKRSDTISAIMENMNEGIILVDKQGVILSVNKSASAFFELDAPMDGRGVLEAIRDVGLLKNLRQALAGRRGEMSMEHSGRTYQVFFSPVTDSGAIILFLDITEKMMGEKMRREFSANVSHELKTPLTSIYGHAEMLAGGMVKDADKQGFLYKIKDEAKRLIFLIEDIILISRLDEGERRDSFEETDIVSAASEAADALSLKAEENDVNLRISGRDVFIRADYSMIYEMFYNLIDNAIKYNKPGGTVDVDIAEADGHIDISVTDTGIGIPAEAQPRVFERFYRAEKSRSKKTGGTGLGLAIVKHIVIIHGGRVMLKSRENEGTAINVVFPESRR